MVFNSLPVDAPLRVTSPFGPRNTGIPGATKFHEGVDLGRDFSKPHTNIIAVAPGTIQTNGWNDYRGWYVIVKHDVTYQTLYQHMEAKCPLAIGASVQAKTKLGVMGHSSNEKKLKVATHLHFELRKNGKCIDPLPSLKSIKEDVLQTMTKQELETLIDQKIDQKINGTNTTVPSWATDYWKWCCDNGLLDGTSPGGVLTRAQMSVVTKKLYTKAVEDALAMKKK